LTENTQPALLVCSVAAFQVCIEETGFTPTVVAGHSLGEYSALVSVGAIPLGTATRWVRERGKSMQLAVPAGMGSMAAILGLAQPSSSEESEVKRLCELATERAKKKRANGENSDLSIEAIVEPANFNAPGQTVIAGSSDAVQEAVLLIKEGKEFPGAKAIPLQVSAPFHCRLMAPSREKMAEIFSNATSAEKPKSLRSPYVPIAPLANARSGTGF